MAGLKVNIVAIHKISGSAPEAEIIADYLKRIPWNVSISELEVKGKFPPDKQKILEGELLLKSILEGSFIISLDERGEILDSKAFAKAIEKIQQPISFVIGGAYGLSDQVRDKSNMLLALGKMTMPHLMARMVLVEQIYRAYTIGQNHPYHK